MCEIIFKGFAKIGRLNRQCTVSEKIDGTNGSIFIGENGEFLTGSRTRWIIPGDDNYGFAKWANEHKEELLKLGKGTHYGEWWGGGIQRNYGLAKDDKRFSLFNTMRWCLFGETPKQIITGDPRIIKYQEVLPQCCGLVPILYEGLFDTFIINGLLKIMTEQGSMAVKGFMKPEGVVIYHKSANVYFKATIEKDDEYKGKNDIRRNKTNDKSKM